MLVFYASDFTFSVNMCPEKQQCTNVSVVLKLYLTIAHVMRIIRILFRGILLPIYISHFLRGYESIYHPVSLP